MEDKFPKLKKDIHIQIQEAQKNTRQKRPERNSPLHIIVRQINNQTKLTTYIEQINYQKLQSGIRADIRKIKGAIVGVQDLSRGEEQDKGAMRGEMER